MSEGFNIFRVPFLMERMVPSGLTGPVSPAYMANYTGTINYITSKGGYAIVDPHNYGRYNGNIITDTAGFQTFWTTIAAHFKTNANAIFDTNNEYHDMDQTLILNLNQAAINGIRAAGATSQYIFAEGNNYSAAMTWNTTNDNLKTLVDPENNLIYEMHQYLDSDNSGTSATCVSSTIGYERVVGATAWLRNNGKKGIIGETAGGANSVCLAAITGMLQHMKQNDDVWMGALWWGGGPWWGDVSNPILSCFLIPSSPLRPFPVFFLSLEKMSLEAELIQQFSTSTPSSHRAAQLTTTISLLLRV